MSLHLVTGYAGKAHVTSADQGAFNAGVFGTGEYVMYTGQKLSAQVISNNQIRIFDGDIMMRGRHINIKKDTYEDVAIANGLQGLNRNDLIVLRYTKDASTGVENVALAVLQGVSTEGTASDPSYTSGDILSGECLLSEMPLYRVPLTGLNVGELVPLFIVAGNIVGHTHDGRYYTKAEVDAKMNAINDDLTASDGTAFQFAYNAETGEYGYMAKVAGADTFCPFSNAKKLYEALQYSGLVTEDMTFDEMCEAIEQYFPEIYKLYMSSANEGEFAIYQSTGDGTLTFGDELILSQTTGGSTRTKIYSKLVDMTTYKTLHFDHVSTSEQGNAYSWIMLAIDKARIDTVPNITLPSGVDKSNSVVTYILLPTDSTYNGGEVTIDLSNLVGEYYISVFIHHNVGGKKIQTKISNMKME